MCSRLSRSEPHNENKIRATVPVAGYGAGSRLKESACRRLYASRRHLVGELDLAAGSAGFEDGELDLERRQAPAPIVWRGLVARNRVVELMDHHVAAVHRPRNLDFPSAFVVVDQQSRRRLADVAMFAAHEGQAVEGVVALARVGVRRYGCRARRGQLASALPRPALRLVGSLTIFRRLSAP